MDTQATIPIYARHWSLDYDYDFLNHGSFGACPLAILNYQRELLERLEKEPVRFFIRELEPQLEQARQGLATFIGSEIKSLVFVENATAGVNTVLRSLSFSAGDEILVNNHEYNACRNAVEYVAGRVGASVVVASIPFPVDGDEEIIEAIIAKVTPKTKLALISHVTSPTALIFPVKEIVQRLKKLGVETLVDGAHAPGELALNIEEIDPTYYTGNCHKWLCSPKGAGFLYVNIARQDVIKPLCISHGANSPRTDRSRFLLEFDWVGTRDPSAFLCIEAAIAYLGSLFPGGWQELREKNRRMALEGRMAIASRLDVALPCPDRMIGAMASIGLPKVLADKYKNARELQDKLFEDFKIEVPIVPWMGEYSMLVRISAQIYNYPQQYERLAEVLKSLI